nr:acetyltransferase [Pseudonocardia sp. AL041005-10]
MPPSVTPADGPSLDAPVTLRPLVRADLAVLRRWLAAPHVHRWWFHETTDEALERDFGAGLRGRNRARTSSPSSVVSRSGWSSAPAGTTTPRRSPRSRRS